jgi:hypothetical protein
MGDHHEKSFGDIEDTLPSVSRVVSILLTYCGRQYHSLSCFLQYHPFIASTPSAAFTFPHSSFCVSLSAVSGL